MATNDPYRRDLIGYGENPPVIEWPNGARVALSFVLNYEEGGEYSVEWGDERSENFITEVTGDPVHGDRDVNTESLYDYGSRAGVWRMLRLFDEYRMPMTVFAVGQALEANPDVGRAFAQRGHEVASHHWRWIDYRGMPEDVEREHVRRAIEVIERTTGQRPQGWYGGRTSMNSRRLAMEEGFAYDNDVYDDDLPHWTQVDGKPLLLVPYTLDNNDFKFSTSPGFVSGDDFTRYLMQALDTLLREGESTPKMMSVGLHCRMAGKPARNAALRAFLDHVADLDGVWVCRRHEIADIWNQQIPPPVETVSELVE
jgi:putative urate catabolism protein